jgi:hypothetical protein
VNQIVKLTVDISDNDYGLLHLEHIWLLSHDGGGTFDEFNKLLFLKSTFSEEMLPELVNIWHRTIVALGCGKN